MGDSFELLEQEILAKRIELNREIFQGKRREVLEVELVRLFEKINTNYFISTNTDLTHTERFSGMLFEVLSDNRGSPLAGGGDTAWRETGDSSIGVPPDRHDLGDTTYTIHGLKTVRDNFNKHLFSVLDSHYGDTEDIPTLQKYLVFRRAEFLAEDYDSGDFFRDKLIDDLDNLYNHIIPIVRSTNDPNRIEEYIVYIKRDYETVIVYRNEIIRRDREERRSIIRLTDSHEERFKNDLITGLDNLYTTVIPIITLSDDRTVITIEKYIVFVNDDYHKDVMAAKLDSFKDKLDDLYEAIEPLAIMTRNFDIMERIIDRMERTYVRTRSRDPEADIPAYLTRLDDEVNEIVMASTSIELITSYIEIKTREIEQYFPGNRHFINRLGDVTYRRREVIADSRSVDDLIKEYNFSFAKRIKVEKDVNKIFFDTWSYKSGDTITGSDPTSSFRIESATRIRFENKIIGDTTTEFLTDYKAILNKLNLAKDDEYEKVQDLVVKSRLLKAIGDTAINEDTTNRYFYFVNERNKLEDFFKRLTTEAAAQEEITRQKEKEYLNSFDVLEERKRRSLRVTVSRLHSVVEKVFNDFSTGRINKEIFERRLAELERVRR